MIRPIADVLSVLIHAADPESVPLSFGAAGPIGVDVHLLVHGIPQFSDRDADNVAAANVARTRRKTASSP